MVPSTDPEANSVPSGLQVAQVTASVCPNNVIVHRPVLSCQTLIDLSNDADNTIRPHGLNSTQLTRLECALLRRVSHLAVFADQILTSQSHEPEARWAPSGLQLTAATPDLDPHETYIHERVTPLVWPVSAFFGLIEPASQMRMSPARHPDASHAPGFNLTRI